MCQQLLWMHVSSIDIYRGVKYSIDIYRGVKYSIDITTRVNFWHRYMNDIDTMKILTPNNPILCINQRLYLSSAGLSIRIVLTSKSVFLIGKFDIDTRL